MKKNEVISRREDAFTRVTKEHDIKGLIVLMDELAECLITGQVHQVPHKVEETDSTFVKAAKRAENMLVLSKSSSASDLRKKSTFDSYEGRLFLQGLSILRKDAPVQFVKAGHTVVNSPNKYPENCDKELAVIKNDVNHVIDDLSPEHDFTVLQIIYDWFRIWHKAGFSHEKDNVSKVRIMQQTAADVTKRLVIEGDDRILSLLNDDEKAGAFFPFSWLHIFGRFVVRGFLNQENEFLDLLYKVYEQNAECSLNLAACVIDERSYEEHFSDDLRQKCFDFIDTIIKHFSDKDDVLLGKAYGIKYVWHPNENVKNEAYKNLYSYIQEYDQKHPEQVLQWIRLILFHKNISDKNFENLINSFVKCLGQLSSEQAFTNMHPNIVNSVRIIDNLSHVENAVLSAMRKAENIENMRVLEAYVDLALQKNKTGTFYIKK